MKKRRSDRDSKEARGAQDFATFAFPCSLHGHSLRTPSQFLSPIFPNTSPSRLKQETLPTDLPGPINIPFLLPARCGVYKQPPKRPGSKNWLKENKLYRKPTPLHKLDVGQCRLGTVRNLVPYGAYINIGAVKDGLVHLRDMSEEYVAHASYIVSPGDCVETYVKYVDEKRNILALSLIPVHEDFEGGHRVGITDLHVGQRILSIVKRVTNYGAYVDIGCTINAWVHVGALWSDKPRAVLNELKIGEKVWVIVESIDTKKNYIGCRARTKYGTRKLEELKEDGRMNDEEAKEETEKVLKDHPRYGEAGRPKVTKYAMRGDIEPRMKADMLYGRTVIDRSDTETVEKYEEIARNAERIRPQWKFPVSNPKQTVENVNKKTGLFDKLREEQGSEDGMTLEELMKEDFTSDGSHPTDDSFEKDFREEGIDEEEFEDAEGESLYRDSTDNRGQYIADETFLEEMERAASERFQVMDKTPYSHLPGKRVHWRPPEFK